MTRTKAGQLFKVAASAYERGEQDCAKEICLLAFESDDFDTWMRGGAGSKAESGKETEAELKASLEEAIDEGDLATADTVLQKLSKLSGNESDKSGEAKARRYTAMDMYDDDEDLDDDLDDLDDDLDDLDDIDDDIYASNEPLPYLKNDQIASVLKVAAKIKKAGHEDLSKKITDKLGV